MIYHAFRRSRSSWPGALKILAYAQITRGCSAKRLLALSKSEARFGGRSRVGRREERSVPQTGRLNPPHLSFSGSARAVSSSGNRTLTPARRGPTLRYRVISRFREGGAIWTSFARA